MKQREDNLTADMFGDLPKATRYMFYVETTSGEIIEWHGLTRARVKQMHTYTNQTNPCNVVRSGWEEEK